MLSPIAPTPNNVMPGLDPGIQPTSELDRRIKSGDDGLSAQEAMR